MKILPSALSYFRLKSKNKFRKMRHASDVSKNNEYQQSLSTDCATIATAEALDLEEEKMEGENLAHLVSLDDK